MERGEGKGKMMSKDYNFDLKQIRSFLEVVREKNFTRASRRLKLGQATISHHISSLEEMMGVRLINRTSKNFALTDEGESFRKFCEGMLDSIENLRRDLEDALPAGATRITSSTIPSTYILPAAISRIRSSNSKLFYNVEVSDSREAIETIKEGRTELAIVGRHMKHPALEFIHILTDTIILIAPPGFQDSITVKDLPEIPLVVREKGSGTRNAYEQELLTMKIQPSDLTIAFECTTSEAIKESVIAGIGAAFISSLAISREIRAGLLKTVNIPGLSITRDFYAVKQKNRTLSAAAQTLLNELCDKGKKRS